MYSPRIVARQTEALAAAMAIPATGEDALRETPPAEVDHWCARLADARGPKGEELRPLSQEEQRFIRDELVLTKCSYRYWAERYAFCSKKGAGIKRMFPLLPAQELIIAEFGRIEEAREGDGSGDGILANVLKARRLGATTQSIAMTCHRLTTQTYLNAVTAADVPENSSFNFGMLRLMYERLPWYLKPGLRRFSNTYPEAYEFENGCQVWSHAGESSRGTTGDRGQIGRGKGISICHLGELCMWEDTGQIDSALLPTMEPDPRILAIFESSPRGRSSWWHRHWETCVAGKGRFAPIFIPWYADEKYSRQAPISWEPAASTLAHARRCEAQGKQWLHRDVTLTRGQLYWYESGRAYYEHKEEFNEFLQEYAADPDECFVFSGRPLIPLAAIQRTVDRARPLAGCFEIAALMDFQQGGPRA